MTEAAAALTGEELALVRAAERLGAASALESRLFPVERLAGRVPGTTLATGAADEATPVVGVPRYAPLTAIAAGATRLGDLEGLDRTWIAAAVAGEPAGLVAALVERDGVPADVRATAIATVAGDGAAEGAWDVPAPLLAELESLVFGGLEALGEPASGLLGAELSRLTAAELMDELARWGARTLGISLAGGPFEVRARAMASVGAPWAAELAAAAAAMPPPDSGTRDRARRWVASVATGGPAAAGRTGEAGARLGLTGGSPPRPGAQAAATVAVPSLAAGAPAAGPAAASAPIERLRGVGLLALAWALGEEGPGSVARVAGRLPRQVGRLLLDAAAQRRNESIARTVDLP
jgi:hypothetical protein